MSRRWLLSLLCLAIGLLLLVQLTRAEGVVRVNEAQTKVLLQNDPLEVQLSIDNSLAEISLAKVRLELLDPQNYAAASDERVLSIGVGKHVFPFHLPLDIRGMDPQDQRQLPCYRLHYKVTDLNSVQIIAEGLVSLSQIASDLFVVRVAAAEMAHEGMPYRTRVQTIHPITGKPVGDVRIDSVVTLETDDQGNGVKLQASGTTASDGYAVLNFVLPARFPQFPHELRPAGGSLHVVARRGVLVAEEENEILVDQFPRILISTDKPLYQPGQALHLRALALSPSRHVLPEQMINFRIEDPEDTLVFRDSIKSTRFGIGSVDWPIPDNTRLGDYSIKVSLGDGTGEDSSLTYARVRISRYELPNFSVKVKSDRPYYLADQNAEVRVSADYIFGQTVTRGKVRVVRETEREWNYREQKWEIEEGDKYEGETDSNGVFVAHVSLSDYHKDIAGEDYRKFRDISYAAYFTDATTNRTEQRRFDLRVTKDPIHVYVSGSYYSNSQSDQLPVEFYVSTFYADGSPAKCKVSLAAEDENDNLDEKSPRVGRPLATVSTNRYGLAKVKFRVKTDDNLSLKVVARDVAGRTGSSSEDISINDSDEIRLETNKSLYQDGEPITLTLASSVPNLNAVVDVAQGANVLSSQRVRLHSGRALLTIPYRSEFKDKVTLAAYADFADEPAMIATRTILFPKNQDLKIDAHAQQKSYRPGDEAQVNFQVRAPGGQSTAGALGLVIVDKAVDERFRTDQEFGNRSAGFYGSISTVLGSDEQIAGITLAQLQRLDMSRPVPPDLDLAAEVMLNQNRNYYPMFFGGASYETDQAKVFKDSITRQLDSVKKALATNYAKSEEYPHTEEHLKTQLLESGIDLQLFHDPWGNHYNPVFSVDKESDVLSLRSMGADKKFHTDDDFSLEIMRWAYFRPVGLAIDRAVRQYHQTVGRFIRDFATLRSEVEKTGSDLDSLRDRWGEPYHFDFDVDKTSFVIKVTSSGPDKHFSTGPYYFGDDFPVWSSAIDYFAETRAQIDTALNGQLTKTNHLPQNENELRKALSSANIDLDALKDPWGHRLYLSFSEQSFYGNRVTIETQAKYGEQAKERTLIVPVTQHAVFIKLRSAGPDGREGTIDDFDALTFTGMIAEQTMQDRAPKPLSAGVGLLGETGAIVGVVTDQQGALVANADVSAKNSSTLELFETKTDDEGHYLLRNLPAGSYEVIAETVGFKRLVLTSVPVTASNFTEVNISLEPGAVSEVVTVTAAAASFQTSQSSVSELSIERRQLSSIDFKGRSDSRVRVVTKSGSSSDQTSTPRLREYFPETLLWQPSLETDKQGRAQLKFKLADNITTWRMSVIGSTEDGEIGTVETEIKSFQPFFVEHDPPRVLTEGDQISLPVVLRNYLERAQIVDLEIKPESWFTLQGPARQRANVPAGDATRQTFDLKAVASVKDGKQRVTARGPEASDAIEKPVTVHPDGEEKTQTASDVLGDAATLEMDLPASVIPGSRQVELKVYPSLMAHVVESIEGILERPHGCGEQTISSTYPSLFVLRRNKQAAIDSGTSKKAQRYAQLGYERLLNYRAEDGGFTYWGRGEADLALTAYALRFLHDAQEFVTVDDQVIKDARQWLIKQQHADGSWPAYEYGSQSEDQRRTTLLTAFVARVLGITESSAKPAGTSAAKPPAGNNGSPELQRALSFLATKIEAIDEPYLIASYALAALEAGDKQGAARAAAKLRRLAHNEGNTTYWMLETNTPFYGWGLAGRVETTALAIQALTRSARTQSEDPQLTDPLVRSGLLFLLRQKDRYGVWYSTQATINVLDTLMTLLATEGTPSDRRSAASSGPVEIIINGQLATSLNLPPGEEATSLIRADISRFLHTGANHLQLRRAAGSAFASVQLVANYYVPWSAPGARVGETSALRLTATFDKTAAKINDEIVCHVKAERVGFRGYGMLLAEIGLPPGADVDRASLESAMKTSGWAISQYDVLPDRVVVYLWAYAGGSDFAFKFRPRFALTAKTAPSVVYDYYNPEARAVVVPATFVVR